jgi:hypothetical protein
MLPPLRILLDGLIDYAGLFPPAALSMPEAVLNYAAYRIGPDRWVLGRFVVTAERLPELEHAADGLAVPGDPWPLSVLVGANDAGQVDAARAFHARHMALGDAHADVLEGRASGVEAIAALAAAARPGFTLYVEVPADPDPAPLIAAIGAAGVRAKIRTGGVTADAFPTAAQVARFLAACIRAGVPFKATAGLHHPIRAVYPLTYAPDAPRGTMFGYLNVFLAATLLHAGGSEADAARLLEESRLGAFAFSDDGVHWDGHRFTLADLAGTRRLALGVGSCSFDEPLDDLATAGLR